MLVASAPSLITLHQQVTSCHTNLQVFISSTDLTSLLLVSWRKPFSANSHTMQSIFIQDCFQFSPASPSSFASASSTDLNRKGKGYHIKSRVKSRIDQVAVHGNLYRISVDQSLNTFRLVSVGQLVCSIHIDFNFTACRFFLPVHRIFFHLLPRYWSQWWNR